MAAGDDWVDSVEGLLIVVSGMIMIPIVTVDLICNSVNRYFNEADPGRFDDFFRNALLFSELEAKNLRHRYLLCATAFGFEPGLGATRGPAVRQTVSAAAALEAELTRLGVGNIGVTGRTVELRLSEFLKPYRSATAAKNALSPAKRDALRMEARKLLNVPPKAWLQYQSSRFVSIGVRG